MKIVYCLNSVRYLGGIQRVTIVKANALAEIPGNEVYVVVTDNKAGVQVGELSPKVHLVDLDINYYKNDQQRSKLANIVVFSIKRRAHKKALTRLLHQLNPDVVISVGFSEKYMLLSMRNRTWKVIREFHTQRYYRKLHAESRFDKIVASVVDFYDFKFKEPKYDRIIVLTEQDKEENWKGWNNVDVVPNPVTFSSEIVSQLNQKTVVSLGRLEHVKNFSSLINSFKIVAQKHPDWKLAIYGIGTQEQQLRNLIANLGLENNVFLMGYSNAQDVLCQSSIFALSSLCEGFALVLVEAMECGVPAVSYQCPCGPKDIITEGEDGFLVPQNDEAAMADRICRLIEDEELRKHMGAAAKITARKYQVESIAERWMELFNDIVKS